MTFEGRQVFERRVGHEGGSYVRRHHHDGWSASIAGHFALGGHGSLLLKAHCCC